MKVLRCHSGCIACAPLWERRMWGILLLSPFVWAAIRLIWG